MPTSKLIWNLLARRYSRQAIADETAYEHKLTVTRKYLTPESTVLEFGCGTGSTALLHAPLVQDFLAIDYSPRMIEIAREKLAETDITNLTFNVTSLDELQAPDGSFDVILGLNILHLLKNRQGAIEKVHRLLKPSGYFIASTPCLARSSKGMRIAVTAGAKLGLLPHVSFFNRETLHTEFKDAGFTLPYKWEQKPSPVLFTVAQKSA